MAPLTAQGTGEHLTEALGSTGQPDGRVTSGCKIDVATPYLQKMEEPGVALIGKAQEVQ
jgi:hypothetical protein